MKHETVAMILAGGQGTRLGALTQDIAKPAVHFGGKYRIIDFPLSNCSNSGLEVVGVLTQYQPLQLNTYIGSGAAWDLNRMNAGVYVLPPYMSNENEDWYKGTANAIYQNMAFIDNFSPDNVVVLGGDHIYKMDYSKMIAEHKRNKAIATIAVIEVPWEEASRFGILESDADGRVVEFVEKPKNPKSNLASMGIYVFDWETLRDHLIVDEANPDSENDFGNNIIPQMLAQSKDVFTYTFDGYWKDVGTVTSLWESNMDLIDTVVDGKIVGPKFDLHDSKWRIYSKNPVKPPHYIAPEAKVANSCITEGCEIYGSVKDSIIFEGVVIGKGSIVEECVIMPNTIIGENVIIKKTIIGENASIEHNCRIGIDEMVGNPYYSPMCNEGVVLVGNEIIINENMIVPQQSMIKKNIIVQDSKIREKINKSKVADHKDSENAAKTEIA